MDRHIARTIVRNLAGDARVIWCIFSGYHPQGLRESGEFAVHVWTAGRASSGRWFTARFFATKNCTASRLKVWTSLLYPFAICLLDFWSRINELLLIFGRWKWCTSTWWKQHGGPKQWTRNVVQINFIFLSPVLTMESILFQSRVKFFFYLVTEFIT